MLKIEMSQSLAVTSLLIQLGAAGVNRVSVQNKGALEVTNGVTRFLTEPAMIEVNPAADRQILLEASAANHRNTARENRRQAKRIF